MLNITSSEGVMARPSTSAPTRAETRSSPGSAALVLACWSRKTVSSVNEAIWSSVRVDIPSDAAIVASDQRLKSERSASGTPSSSAMASTGSGAQRPSTRSIGSARGSSSSSATVSSRMRASMGPTARGVKRRFSTRRHSPCWGGSMWMIDPSTVRPSSRIGSLARTPPPERKRSGLRLTSRMSS